MPSNPGQFLPAPHPIAEQKTLLVTRPWLMYFQSLVTQLVTSGDVFGPSSSLNNQIVLFSGTTGKLIKGATGTGFVKAVAPGGIYSVVDISQEGYWSPLTNGDPVSPEIIYDSFGDTISVWTPTP